MLLQCFNSPGQPGFSYLQQRLQWQSCKLEGYGYGYAYMASIAA